MKIPSTSQDHSFTRRKRACEEEPARVPKGAVCHPPVRRAHGLEAPQRFFLDAWLNRAGDK